MPGVTALFRSWRPLKRRVRFWASSRTGEPGKTAVFLKPGPKNGNPPPEAGWIVSHRPGTREGFEQARARPSVIVPPRKTNKTCQSLSWRPSAGALGASLSAAVSARPSFSLALAGRPHPAGPGRAAASEAAASLSLCSRPCRNASPDPPAFAQTADHKPDPTKSPLGRTPAGRPRVRSAPVNPHPGLPLGDAEADAVQSVTVGPTARATRGGGRSVRPRSYEGPDR